MINRREFLRRSTLGAVSLALPSCLPAFGTAVRPPSGMFLSLPPWAVARNVGWPEQARVAARAGYKGIDWSFGPAKAAGVDATRALFAKLAIEPTIVNLPMRDPLGADDTAFAAQLPTLVAVALALLVLRARAAAPNRPFGLPADPPPTSGLP